jgi:phage baseplate assembly protein W
MAYKIQLVDDNVSNDNSIGVSSNFNGSAVFVSTRTSADAVISNLKNLLLTRVGERYNNPTFGTKLLDVIFEPSNDFLKQDINEIISDAVNRWIPEINLVSIDSKTSYEDPTIANDVQVTITFSLNSERIYMMQINANESGTLNVQQVLEYRG